MSEPPAPASRLRPGRLAIGVLVAVVVLCGVIGAVGWSVTTQPHGTGSNSPQDAVTGFLTSVYLHEDAEHALDYLCPQGDPGDVTGRVDDVADLGEKHNNVMYTWGAYTVTRKSASEVTVTTVLTRTARDLPTTSQALTIDTVENHGWWVCGVRPAAK